MSLRRYLFLYPASSMYAAVFRVKRECAFFSMTQCFLGMFVVFKICILNSLSIELNLLGLNHKNDIVETNESHLSTAAVIGNIL